MPPESQLWSPDKVGLIRTILPTPEKDGLQDRERPPHIIVGLGQPLSGDPMARHLMLVGLIILGGLMTPACALAQFPPPAGSAGAGNSAISGIPYGPANPGVIGDPSGIGNASRIPPLGTNTPPPPTSYGSLSPSPSPPRVVTPSYSGASQRIIVPRQARSGKSPARPHGRVETSKFTGICRGC
jgi:hypothetical protein